jgi:flagellar basal-body rod modification protein FlgD
MTTIQNSTAATTTAATNAANNAASQSALSGTSSTDPAAAQDRFLTLLVTQLKNQDPLNPLDNSQVTSQLAQLSTVSGIDKLNTTVEGLQSSYQTSQALQSANLIGHGVLSPGSGLTLSGGKGVFGVELSGPADNVKVNVLNANKKVVHTVDLGAQDTGVQPLGWDGKDDTGATLPDGEYTVQVTSTLGGKSSTNASALTFGQVGSVSSGTQGVKLNIQGVGPVNLSDVRQIL